VIYYSLVVTWSVKLIFSSFGYGNMNAVMAGIAAFAALISYAWLERLPSKRKDSIAEVGASDS
jgi:hypothetical protein